MYLGAYTHFLSLFCPYETEKPSASDTELPCYRFDFELTETLENVLRLSLPSSEKRRQGIDERRWKDWYTKERGDGRIEENRIEWDKKEESFLTLQSLCRERDLQGLFLSRVLLHLCTSPFLSVYVLTLRFQERLQFSRFSDYCLLMRARGRQGRYKGLFPSFSVSLRFSLRLFSCLCVLCVH